jgi:2-iminobutanoate/2-iminopropanoate deaminase
LVRYVKVKAIKRKGASVARSWEPVELGKAFPAPVGAYSPVIRAGDLLFVSGQVPTDPGSGKVVGATVAEQTRYVIEKLGRTLVAAGASLSDVVSVSAYLGDIGDWDEFNQTYKQCFQAPYPTRTTVGAELHGVLVEISAIAHVRRA